MTIAFATFTEELPDWSMMNLAQGYLDSALVLCDGIETRRHPRNGGIYSLLPIINALHQGLEDFLKGASLLLDEKTLPKTIHNLEELGVEYANRVSCGSYPSDLVLDKEIIQWVSWWDREASNETGPGEGPRFLHGRSFRRSYEGLLMGQRKVASIATSCKNECVRVHIRLIQEFVPVTPNTIIHPLQPWWEPNESFEARVGKRIKELGIAKAVTMRSSKGGGMEVVKVWGKGE